MSKQTTPMKFGMLRFARDMNEYVSWCQLVERVGLDLIAAGDSSTMWIDPFVTLTAAALHTTRARLAITVTNPVTRHPAVMASACAGLQSVSGGRAVLGISGGDSAVLNLGLRPAPLAEVETYLQCVRALCANQETTYRGQKIKIQWPVQRMPIWIAADGAKALRLAGGIADGVVVHLGIDEASVKEATRHIHDGARAAGRNPAEVEVWWVFQAYISKTEAEGWRELRYLTSGIANHVFRFTFEGKAVPPELQEPLRALQRDYRPDLHVDDRHADGHNAQIVDNHGLREFLGRRFLLCGPPEQIAQNLRRMASWGATNFLFINVAEDRISALRQLNDQVLKLLR